MEFGRRTDPRQRMAGIGLVVLLHVGAGYALMTGLAHKVVEMLPAPLEIEIIEEDRPVAPPPPPPAPPEFDLPPPTFIPPPEINIAPPPRQQTIATVTPHPQPPPPPPVAAPVVPAAPVAAVRVAPVIDAKRNCREPVYPAISVRLGEVGSVVLSLLVGVDGRVTDSRVDQSSGYRRLDQAAIKGLSLCRFAPGTVDGKPEPAWAKIRYTFVNPD